MQGLTAFRKRERESIQRQSGIARGLGLVTQADVANAQAQNDVVRLPEHVSESCEIQSAGGGWLYMVDMSAIDGPEPIA